MINYNQLSITSHRTNITHWNSIPFLEVKTYTVQQKDKMTNKNKNCFRYINTTQLIVRHKLLLSFFIYLFFWINIGISNREIYGRRNSLHLLPVNKSRWGHSPQSYTAKSKLWATKLISTHFSNIPFLKRRY